MRLGQVRRSHSHGQRQCLHRRALERWLDWSSSNHLQSSLISWKLVRPGPDVLNVEHGPLPVIVTATSRSCCRYHRSCQKRHSRQMRRPYLLTMTSYRHRSVLELVRSLCSTFNHPPLNLLPMLPQPLLPLRTAKNRSSDTDLWP